MPLLGVALAICLLEVTVRAVRWRWLLQPSVRTSIGSSFVYICVGHFANTLLPFRLGDAARAYLAGSRFGVRRMTVLGTILIERLADGALLLTVVTVALIAGAGVAGVSRVTLLVLASVGLGSALIVSVSRRAVMRTLGARLPRLAHQVGALSDAFASVRSPQRFALLALTTATSFGAAVVIMHLVLSAAGTDLGWWPTAVAISAMTLSTAIPAAPGALGTYEFAGTTALTAFGVRRTPHSQQSWLFMCWQLCHRQSSGSGRRSCCTSTCSAHGGAIRNTRTRQA